MVPFNGGIVPVICRHLQGSEIQACGEFSLIETTADVAARSRKLSVAEMLDYVKAQDAIVRKALVAPTYEELMAINRVSPVVENAEKEIPKIEEIISGLPDGPKRAMLEDSLMTLKLQKYSLLPGDFTAWIVSFALRIDESGIKEVSEDMLYQAALLAERGHDNPADHIGGVWDNFECAKFYRDDINVRAWCIMHERRREENGD
jgi:hypothetical protein